MKRLILVLACLAPTMAAAKPSYFPNLTTPFDPSQTVWAKGAGTGTIKGSALLRTVAGDVKTCAGFTANLIPRSDYAGGRMIQMFKSAGSGFMPARGAKQWQQTDARYVSEIRQTTCDPDGRFEFTSVPAGAYYVTAPVTWGVPTRYFTKQEGGMLMKLVIVEDGATVNTVLTY